MQKNNNRLKKLKVKNIEKKKNGRRMKKGKKKQTNKKTKGKLHRTARAQRRCRGL